MRITRTIAACLLALAVMVDRAGADCGTADQYLCFPNLSCGPSCDGAFISTKILFFGEFADVLSVTLTVEVNGQGNIVQANRLCKEGKGLQALAAGCGVSVRPVSGQQWGRVSGCEELAYRCSQN